MNLLLGAFLTAAMFSVFSYAFFAVLLPRVLRTRPVDAQQQSLAAIRWAPVVVLGLLILASPFIDGPSRFAGGSVIVGTSTAIGLVSRRYRRRFLSNQRKDT